MSAADTAMLLAMIAQLGEFRANDDGAIADELPSAGAERDAQASQSSARVLRLGKSLSYGEVDFTTPDGKLAAHATTTYALL